MQDMRYEDAIYDLATAVDYALGGGHDPGCGVCYFNDVFEMHGFWTHAEDNCSVACDELDDWELGAEHTEDCPNHSSNSWLFWHKPSGFKFGWYKRIGRSSEVIGDVYPKMLDWYKIVVECIESVKKDSNPDWRCARHG